MKPHPVLFPFSLLYGCIIWARNLFFDIGILKPVDAGVPVISVGNITAGGTGKTPVVIAIGQLLIEAGRKVAVICRGYGRKSNGTVVVCDGKQILADAEKGGDEPVLIAQRLKSAVVIADKNRVRGAVRAIHEYNVEIIILDDGFQHRYLKRRIDLLLMDGNNSPFNTFLLPAGYRREPINSVKRATAVMVTKLRSAISAQPILERKEIVTQNKFTSAFKATGIRHLYSDVLQSLVLLKGRSAIVVSGIARPQSFVSEVELLGVKVRGAVAFSDHHSYTQEDIVRILNLFAHEKTDFILTTEKDGVKLQKFKDALSIVPIFSLVMDIQVHQHERWKQYIFSVLA